MKSLFAFALLVVAVVSAEENEDARLALQNPDLYDGDMLGIEGPFDPERNAIPGANYRWPNAVVPYVIDSSLSRISHLIQQAIQIYHSRTCIRFKPRTTERNYIKLFYGQGCYSHVGMTGGEQPVSLGSGCEYVGTIIHEIGHALGFYHEQSRSDRDNYLNIYLQNVDPKMQFNFQKLSPNQNILYTPFDYDSIMIYGNKAFSNNGQDTMVAKNGQRLYDPYNKQTMTQMDEKNFRTMYGC